MPDNPTPLAQVEDFNQTAFLDLAENLQPNELASIMLQATRACESAAKRRLAPFTLTESHRAEGIDPDEYGGAFNSVPLDLAGAAGLSYAHALGGGNQARHLWLDEYAPCYQDMWTYLVNEVLIQRSIGGSQIVTGGIGPDPDTGHLWLPLGTFCPVGSQIRVTYSGGYSTTPSDLVAACVTMAASIILKRLDPNGAGTAHDPGALRDEAIELLDPYFRD